MKKEAKVTQDDEDMEGNIDGIDNESSIHKEYGS